MEDGRYACSCRQDDSIIPNNLPEGYSGFVVNLWFRHEVERASGDDALVLDSFRKWIEFHTVENMEMALGSRISCWRRVYLPERIEDLVVEKVVSFAYSIMKDTKNAHKKVLPIAVEVVVRTLQGSMESEQEAIARAFTEPADAILREFLQPIRKEDYQEAMEYVGAIRSKVEAMEYVTVPDSYLGKHCMRCSNEFSAVLRELRAPALNLSLLATRYPYVLRLDCKQFDRIVKEVVEMGVNPLKTMLVCVPASGDQNEKLNLGA